MENWQTVITFTQPHEAHIVKGLLESEGITTFIQDDYMAQVHNFYSNAIGGVKLKIKESDIEHGVEVLKRGGYIIDENTNTQKLEFVPLSKGIDKDICPFCNSDNIDKKHEVGILSIVLCFFLGALFPIFKRSYVCYDCDKEWKYTRIKNK